MGRSGSGRPRRRRSAAPAEPVRCAITCRWAPLSRFAKPACCRWWRCWRRFPFAIRGFHSGNGSEFINYTVSKLLNKSRIGQTKSRPRHSNQHGLAEAKNEAVLRQHPGVHPHPGAACAGERSLLCRVLQFVLELTSALAACPSRWSTRKVTMKRVFRWLQGPGNLRQLPGLAGHLKANVTITEYGTREPTANARKESRWHCSSVRENMLARKFCKFCNILKPEVCSARRIKSGGVVSVV